jgi:hypothetical protein
VANAVCFKKLLYLYILNCRSFLNVSKSGCKSLYIIKDPNLAIKKVFECTRDSEVRKAGLCKKLWNCLLFFFCCLKLFKYSYEKKRLCKENHFLSKLNQRFKSGSGLGSLFRTEQLILNSSPWLPSSCTHPYFDNWTGAIRFCISVSLKGPIRQEMFGQSGDSTAQVKRLLIKYIWFCWFLLPHSRVIMLNISAWLEPETHWTALN